MYLFGKKTSFFLYRTSSVIAIFFVLALLSKTANIYNKSHTKTLKIRPYMFRFPLKPSSGGPWPYFAMLLNWNYIAKYGHGPPEDGFKGKRNM